MIKIGIRPNLIYPFMLIFFTFLRKIITILMDKNCNFKGALLLTLIMFLSEFLFGLFFYIKHIKFVSIKKDSKFMGIKLIQTSYKLARPDSNLKIYILLILSAFFDFIEFVLIIYYLPIEQNVKKIDISFSLDIRLKCLTAFCLAFFCYFLLKYKILRHQKFSLIIILICVIFIVLLEYIVNEENKGQFSSFTIILIIIFLYNFFVSLNDIIGKYLLEFDYINPFQMLMFEGIIGFILSSIYSLIIYIKIDKDENPFHEFIDLQKKDIFLIIIFLILYFIFSGLKNSYRMVTMNLFSPMTRTITDTFIDPLYIIYYYLFEKDFKIKENQKFYYFIINLILSVIIVFSGFIYNEIFIFFCYNLEVDTYIDISNRASNNDLTSNEYYLNDSLDDIPLEEIDSNPES